MSRKNFTAFDPHSSIDTADTKHATTRPRLAGSGRPAANQSQAVRINLFVLVRVLFQYLGKVDKTLLVLAKEVLKDCERKHRTKDSKYESLAEAIAERVRDAVGEAHWLQARKIQKQLAVNQQKKKMKAVQAQRQLNQQKQEEQQKLPQNEAQGLLRDETMEAAKTITALSQALQPDLNLASSSCADQEMNVDSGGNPSMKSKPAPNSEPRHQSQTIHENSSIPRKATSGQLPLRKRIITDGSLTPSAR